MSILPKYFDFVNMFLKKLAAELLKYLSINNYTIDLEESK